MRGRAGLVVLVVLAGALTFLLWGPIPVRSVPVPPAQPGHVCPPEQIGGDYARRLYEAGSLASYSIAILLTVLSLGAPLASGFFNQLVDGGQSLLSLVATEIQRRHARDAAIPPDLTALAERCRAMLKLAHSLAERLRPFFIIISGVSILTIVYVVIYMSFRGFDLDTYLTGIRAFCLTIACGLIAIVMISMIGYKGQYRERTDILSQLSRFMVEK